jgi:hypothetical protein
LLSFRDGWLVEIPLAGSDAIQNEI